jgi:hypothetical protein
VQAAQPVRSRQTPERLGALAWISTGGYSANPGAQRRAGNR